MQIFDHRPRQHPLRPQWLLPAKLGLCICWIVQVQEAILDLYDERRELLNHMKCDQEIET